VKVRPAVEADLEELAALEQDCMAGPWKRAQLAVEVHSSYGLALVAEDEKEIAGYLLMRYLAPEGEVLRIAVAASCRGRGLGRLLLQEAITRLTPQGLTRIFLEVRPSNRSACRFYQRFGFAVFATRTRYYRNPEEDALLMQLTLHSVGG
jgi:[ribosomal protein S18]-alanine N-acetyltransferase